MNKFQPQNFQLKNGKEVLIRQFTHDDAYNYHEFSQKIALETPHTLHYADQTFSIENLKEKWDPTSTYSFHLGAFVDNKIIAHLSCYKPRPYHPYESHIIEFGIRIRKDYCSSGLGSKMLLILESLSQILSFKRLQATVRITNTQGINFYLKNGYTIEGLKKDAVYIDGLYQDEYFISKILHSY